MFKPVILGIFCFIFYGNTIQNNYALDDGLVINDNRFTTNGISGIPDIFKYNSFTGSLGENATLVTGGRYRPLSLTTFAIEYQIFGANPRLSHYFNVLLFLITALLLYKLLIKLFYRYCSKEILSDLPFIATLIFIIHPIHTEVVANIKGRDEIMALGGSLATIIFIIKYLDTTKIIYLISSIVLFLTALLSKENAVTFIAIIPLCIYYYKNEKWIKYLYCLLSLFIALFIFLVMRKLALGDISKPPGELLNNPYIYASVPEKFATIFYTLGIYIKLLFWPDPLTYDYYPYHIKLINWDNSVALLSLIVYISLFVYAIVKLKYKTTIAFGVLFFMITLSIVSNIFFNIGTFMSERFIFIPSIGFVIIIAWLFTVKLPEYIKWVNFRIVFLTIIMTLCFIKTYSRDKVWKNNFTLFTTDVKTSFDSAKSNMAAGNVWLYLAYQTNDSLLRKKYFNNALFYSRRAQSIYPNHVDIAILLANAYSENNILDSAIIYYKKAIDLMPEKTDFIFEKIKQTLNKTNDINFKFNQK